MTDLTDRLRQEAALDVAALDAAYTDIAAQVEVDTQTREEARARLDQADQADRARLYEASKRLGQARDKLIRMKAAHIALERAAEVTP